MKAKDIKVGAVYIAKVNSKLQKVRVDKKRIVDLGGRYSGYRDKVLYDVTNLATNRKLTFRSAAKFRSEVDQPSDKALKAQLKGKTMTIPEADQLESEEEKVLGVNPSTGVLTTTKGEYQYGGVKMHNVDIMAKQTAPTDVVPVTATVRK